MLNCLCCCLFLSLSLSLSVCLLCFQDGDNFPSSPHPSTPGSPSSVGNFSTDRLPHTRSSAHSVSDEAEVDPDIFATDPGDEEEDEGEDLYHDNFMEQ